MAAKKRKATAISVGQKIGHLITVKAGDPIGGRATWECLCSCNKSVTVKEKYLKDGSTKSCGCLRSELCRQRFAALNDRTKLHSGQQFERLTVLREGKPSGSGGRRYLCKCSCGVQVLVARSHLLNGSSKSCGCFSSDLFRQWVADNKERVQIPTYEGLHHRISANRGKARAYQCVDCGNRAREWSLNDLDGDLLLDKKLGLKYSLSLDAYEPRCTSCHQKHDYWHARDKEAQSK